MKYKKENENEFTTIPLFWLMKQEGGVDSFKAMSDLFSSKDKNIENFLKTKAVEFFKQRISATYLVVSFENMSDIVGYFTLATKILTFDRDKISSKDRKTLDRFNDKNSEFYQIPAILIAQFGRNFHHLSSSIKGSVLMDIVLKQVDEILRMSSGKTVFLECEDEAKLVEFYEAHGFKILDTRPDKDEMIQMFRFV